MAQTILIKRSNVQNKFPTNAQIVEGELALNTYDGKTYMVVNSTGAGTGSIVEVGSRLSSLDITSQGIGDGHLSVAGETNLKGANTIIGDAAADILTVNAASTFNANVTVADGNTLTANGNVVVGSDSTDLLTVNSTTDFNGNVNIDGNATLNGNVNLGNAASDIVTISGTASFAQVATFSQGFSTPAGAPASFSGNTTIGDASSDALIVNATTTFNNPVTNNGTLTQQGNATFNGAVSTTGNTTIGDASSDALIVNATSTFNSPADFNSSLNVDGAFTTTGDSTIGNTSADVLTVNATSTFNAPVDMNSTLNVDGAATLNGSVVLGDSSSDSITFNGTPTFVNGPSPAITLTGDVTGTATLTNLGSASIATTVVESNVDHDLLANFVADEHINHTLISITAGNGLTGGGTIAATRTLAVNAGNGLIADGTSVRLTGSYTGDFTATGNVTAYSDAKLKTDLVRIESALDKVDELTGYLYTRIDTGRRETGLLAQDAQKVLPESVIDHDGTLTLAYGNLMGLVVEAIKELRQEIKSLKGE